MSPDELRYRQTVLSELAAIHASLALLQDCFYHLQSGGLSPVQKRDLAARLQQLQRDHLRRLCEQAGVTIPPA